MIKFSQVQVFFIIVFVAVVVVAVVIVGPQHAEYNRAKEEYIKKQKEVVKEKEIGVQLRIQITNIKAENPRAIERLARERLNYCFENEKIYHVGLEE